MFKITAYGADCPSCTGITQSGTVPVIGRTIAVDPTVIPLGSTIMIDGYEYVAEDTGVVGQVIDMFVGAEAESEAWGIKEVEIYILEEDRNEIYD